MNEFQVGDRVTPVDEEKAGDGLTYGEVYTVTRVERPCVLDRVYLREVENSGTSEGWFSGGRFRLAPTPRKDTPKIGDTVRVVLEGKVAVKYGDNSITIEGGDDNNAITISPESGLYESIEILEPAKPSVKDLPLDSVVKERGGSEVYVKIGVDTPKPWTSKWGSRHTDGQIDALDWTLLVPQESE